MTVLKTTGASHSRYSGVLETAALFRIRNYRLFWFGSVFYYTGIWMDQVVRTALAYDLTRSAFELGLVVAAQSLLLSVCSLAGGTLADRVPKLTLMRGAQAVIVADLSATALLLRAHEISFPPLLCLTAVYGAAIGISLPGRLSFVSEIVNAEQFVRAYAFYYVAFNLLNVVGPAIGGAILVGGGPTPGFEFMACSQFLSWLLLLRMRPGIRPRPLPTTGFGADLRSMFFLVRSSQRVALLMAMQGMSVAFVMSTTQLLPVFVARIYHGVVGSGVGTLRASYGLGGLVGALLISQAARTGRKTRLLLTAGAVQGLLLIAFASVGDLALGAVLLVVLGSFQAVYLTLTSTLFATSVDESMRGRAMSLYLLSNVAQPLIIVPLGSLSDMVGVQPTIATCGALFFALSIMIALRYPLFRTAREVSVPAQSRAANEDSPTVAT